MTIGDQQLLKRMNRSVLLRLLRARPGLSRARLADESGLTKSTVSLLVRELLDEGWLSEAGTAVADGLGRPSTPLRINVGVRALMGVEIAVETVRLACVSLEGEVLHADTRALRMAPAHRSRGWPRRRTGDSVRWASAYRASASACPARWTIAPAWSALRPTSDGAT